MAGIGRMVKFFLEKYLLTLLCGYGAGDETDQYQNRNTATIPMSNKLFVSFV